MTTLTPEMMADDLDDLRDAQTLRPPEVSGSRNALRCDLHATGVL